MKTQRAHGKSKLMRIITLPFRALGKVRDMYVRGMTSAEINYGYAVAGDDAGRFSSLPKSYSSRSSRPAETDDFAELIRAASARSYGSRIDVDKIFGQPQRSEPPETKTVEELGSKRLPKCSSVGMAKIDEENTCDFGMDGGDSWKPDLFPRSRSYAVAAKRNLAF